MRNLSVERYRELSENPISVGLYEAVFFFNGCDNFILCATCNKQFQEQYVPDIKTGELTVSVESSSDYDPGTHCDHCGRDISAYAE